jgi:formate dehydrogenase iron-sulfur subunit
MRIWVPRDAAAKALGAEEVVSALRAEAEARGIEVEIRRNGSRGMIWLEPLVEIERDGVRLRGLARSRRSRFSRGRTG